MDKTVKKIIWALLIALLVLSPYATFLLQLVRYYANAFGHPLSNLEVQLTTGWKELIMLIGVILSLIWMIRYRKLPFQLTKFDWFVFAIIILGVGLGRLFNHSNKATIFGFRYDFAVFIVYYLARFVGADRKGILKTIKALIITSVPLLLFGLAQTLWLPADFLARFGYSWQMIVTGNPLPPYHLVGNNIVRAMSTFPGPNSLAMYAALLTLLISILGWIIFKKYLNFTLLLLVLAVLIMTFSRGHIVGLLGGVIIAYLTYKIVLKQGNKSNPEQVKQTLRKQKLPALILTIVLIILNVGAMLGTLRLTSGSSANQSALVSIILRPNSTDQHKDVRKQAWEGIIQKPFGHGIGSAGLATTNLKGTVFNPESWQIQILYEFGWLGIMALCFMVYLLLWTLFVISQDMQQSSDHRLAIFFLASFLAIIFSVNFLPAWYEVATIIWWTLFGLYISDYLQSFPTSPLIYRPK